MNIFLLELVSTINWKEFKDKLVKKYGISLEEYDEFIKSFFSKLE